MAKARVQMGYLVRQALAGLRVLCGKRILVVAMVLVTALLLPACFVQSVPTNTPAPVPKPTNTASPALASINTPRPAMTPTNAPSPIRMPTSAPSLAGTPILPNFSHVFIIMMEDMEYNKIIDSPKAPFINQLARAYAVAASYYGITHPSLPNYLALVSGSTQGMTTDCDTCLFNATNLADQLDQHQKSWGAYVEDAPTSCFKGPSASGPASAKGRPTYVRRHNPLMYFTGIADNPARCNRVVPLRDFAERLANDQLPDFVWITPNLLHDMHDGSIEDGDSWLASFIPPILASPAWKNGGVLFVIHDEGNSSATCCGNAAGGHTVALVVAERGKRGYKSNTPHSHYSVLRTIEDAWHLGLLGHAGDPGVVPMNDFFQ